MPDSPTTTAAEIAAYIGAAAWLPQIGQWAWRAVAKPSLRLISARTVELGYTNYFGPILNMTLAIATSRKDAIIEKMTVQATHGDGDTHLLTWVSLTETQGQLRNVSGETVELAKNQTAIALKVSTLNLTEKKVLFQDLGFQERHGEYSKAIGDYFNHLNSQKETELTDKIIRSREYAAARDHFRAGMYWKEGTYTLTVSMFEMRAKAPHTQKFKCNLEKHHVDLMRLNVEEFEADIRSVYAAADGKKDQPPSDWNWAYPEVKRVH